MIVGQNRFDWLATSASIGMLGGYLTPWIPIFPYLTTPQSNDSL